MLSDAWFTSHYSLQDENVSYVKPLVSNFEKFSKASKQILYNHLLQCSSRWHDKPHVNILIHAGAQNALLLPQTKEHFTVVV